MSLVGFKAQNHPQQARKDRVDDRCVLPEFFEPLHAQHRFTIDAAASDDNHVLPRYWTREQDALSQSWLGERVWCNPPYSDIGPWVEKAWLAMEEEGCHLVVMLLPANRCEQGWWQTHVEPFRDQPVPAPAGQWRRRWFRLSARFLPGRMRFKHPVAWSCPAKGDRPPFGCVLLTWEAA